MANKITVDRGTTFLLTYNYQRNGVAATLVGATVFFTVKSTEFDADSLDATALYKNTKTTYVLPGDNAAGGIAVLQINPSDTLSITPGTYFYDCKVKDASGDIYEIDEGRFIIDGTTTNRL
jgi:hypothetical protein